MDKQTEHIEDLVEGYALDALAPEERAHVEQHVAVCPPCKQQVNNVTQTAHMLGFVAQPVVPPLRCKRNLMEKIEREQFLAAPTRRSRIPIISSTWTTVAAVALVMLTSMWGLSNQRQLTVRDARIHSLQAELTEVQTQLAAFNDMLPEVEAVRGLTASVGESSAVGKCFMKRGKNRAVLVISNLKTLPPGKMYQVWVARENLQQPLTLFNPDGSTANVMIAPPEPMDRYKWIMVTVEDADGAERPSETTVLEGDL